MPISTREPERRHPELPPHVAPRRCEPPTTGPTALVVAVAVAILVLLAAGVAVDSVGVAIAAIGLAVGTGLAAVSALSAT